MTIALYVAAAILLVNSVAIFLLFTIASRLSRNADDQHVQLKSSLVLIRANLVQVELDLHRNYKEFVDCHNKVLERLNPPRK